MHELHEVVLDSPNLNTLSVASMTALRDQLRRADGAPLLLRGEGRAFSAGLDLHEVTTLEGPAIGEFITLLDQLLLDLFTYPGPTVAWVNGHAIAGGCLLALCCDHRIASPHPKIKIGLSEVALGIAFPPGALGIVRYRVAPHRLDELVLGARLYSPSDALERGFLDELADDTGERARACLATLAAHPADGYATAKAALRGAVAEQAAADLPGFLERSLKLWSGDQLKERVAQRLGKGASKDRAKPAS